MRNGKRGWWKRFCKFWESINKREDPSDRMEEVQSVTDSDGNVIVPNGRKTMEIIGNI